MSAGSGLLSPDGLHFGFITPQHWQSYDDVRDLWRYAEDTGWDSAWLMDHFFSMSDGELGPCLEAWTLLAALAPQVPRLVIGPYVSGMTHRHPAVLYKQAATVDAISGGRLILGLGASWNEREHRAHGIPFPAPGERVDRFGEALDMLRLLQSQETTSYQGRYYQLDEMPFAPKPVRGRFPLLIGARGRRMLRHVARHADYWEATGTPDELHDLGEQLATACRSVGREPGEIVRALDDASKAFGSPLESEDAFRRHVSGYTAAGIRMFLFNIPPGPPSPTLRAISETVIPELRTVFAAGELA
jgi:alkanesulfonate monooxygenase SsuD/methylene tetrahydromethanopterin reductase-like flavin-dependent oxidoreductase (luciferase family)